MKKTARGEIVRDGILERRRWRGAAEHGDGRCLNGLGGYRRDAAEAVEELFAERADAGAFGDDRLEVVVLCGGLEQHFAADREADAADPAFVDVGAVAEPGDRGVDVLGLAPAEHVRGAVAAVVAAGVE